jgi:hypothetical protein
MPIDVKRRHTAYDQWREATDFLHHSHVGGTAYIDATAAMLDKYPRELDEIYEERRKRTNYLNHFGSVVDAYVSTVFRKGPIREGAEDEDGQPAGGASPA